MAPAYHHFDPNYWKEKQGGKNQNKCDIQMDFFDKKKTQSPTTSSLKPSQSDNLDDC